jgi:hypothetical protein
VDELALQHVDDGVVAEVGVRTVQHEEVREARHRHAQVAGRAVRPGRVQVDAAPAHDPHRREEARRRETGAVDDDVGRMHAAIAGLDALWPDARDPLGDQFHVRPAEGGQVIARQQDALAADRVIRRELAA